MAGRRRRRGRSLIGFRFQAQRRQRHDGRHASDACAAGIEQQEDHWSDLHGDHDGKLTKADAAPIEALNAAFDDADADADGSLTVDEYKAYLAACGKTGSNNGS